MRASTPHPLEPYNLEATSSKYFQRKMVNVLNGSRKRFKKVGCFVTPLTPLRGYPPPWWGHNPARWLWTFPNRSGKIIELPNSLTKEREVRQVARFSDFFEKIWLPSKARTLLLSLYTMFMSKLFHLSSLFLRFP